MARVMIIEDEPVLRGSMARGLGKLPSLEVIEAGSLPEALSLVDLAAPDCIISDIDLPGRSGLELIGELRNRGLSVPILFVSAYLKAYRSQIPPNAQVEVVEKPVPLEQLRSWILEHLQAPPAARAPFCAADYLQLACMGRHTIEILVGATPAGPARIVVVSGEVWSANDGAGAGVAAFKRCAFHREGPVECRVLEGYPGPRNVTVGWEALLIDTARELDEKVRDANVPAPRPAGKPPPPAAGPPRTAPPPPKPSDEDRFAECWDRGIAALLRKDHGAALRAFLEARALRPGDPRVAANLKRLEDLGFRAAPGGEG